MTSEAPRTPNADSWALWLSEFQPGTEYLAVQISEAMDAHALAMVAAEREACADLWVDVRVEGSFATAAVVAMSDRIRARTTDDERAALDALLKAERVKALRKAAAEIGNLHCIANTPQLRLAMSALTETGMDAILALIEKETGQ